MDFSKTPTSRWLPVALAGCGCAIPIVVLAAYLAFVAFIVGLWVLLASAGKP